MSFLKIMLCYHFSLEAFLQDIILQKKITLQKNNSKQKLQSGIKACARMKTDRRENVKFIVTNYKDRCTS